MSRVLLAIARGEAPWQSLRDHGFEIHVGPPFNDIHFPDDAHPITVRISDVVAGFNAQLETRTSLSTWAFVVHATTSFYDDNDRPADTDADEQTLDEFKGLLWDAAFGVEPAEVRERLARFAHHPVGSEKDDAVPG